MKMFSGVITALITPFNDGQVDFGSLGKLVDHQLKDGIDGFVINGTTAESPSLTSSERKKIFQFVQERVPNGFPLIMGTGSNSTAKTIEESKEAEKLGAQAVLVVVPYYNKPPQRGLFAHFKAVADAINIPVILYNVPSRTITGLETETIKKLSEHPNIIGIKEATGNIEFAKQIRSACGNEFLLLSGDDGTYDDFMKAGGDGVISVASHIIAKAMKKKKAGENIDLINALFCEANPIPLKMALYLQGVIQSPELRLPLVPLSAHLSEKLKNEMKNKGLLS
jgi:4-hydroxy-tetrahydrodipicolinate synthase